MAREARLIRPLRKSTRKPRSFAHQRRKYYDLHQDAGHLHIAVGDLPWAWANYGQSNTVILVNLPCGEHKVLIEVVDREGSVLTAQTVTFTSPGK